MKRQTSNRRYRGAGVLIALAAAVTLIICGCGGPEPAGEGDPGFDPRVVAIPPPAGALLVDGPAIDPSLLDPRPSLIDPSLLEPVRDLPLPKATYKRQQVLALCNGGTLTVDHTHVRRQLQRTFTLELWMNADETIDQRVVSAGDLMLGIRGRRIVASVGGQELSGLAMVAHEWYHVALVVMGQELTLFVNGMLLDAKDQPNVDWARPHGALVLGGDADVGQAFCGTLDSVRLTGERLYVDEFYPQTELKPLDSGPFFYNFDDQRSWETVYDAGYWGVNARIAGEAAMVAGGV